MRKLLITLGTAVALLALGSGPSLTQGGNTLTVAIQGDLGDLDPHVNQLILFKWIRLNVFNSLVRLDENLQIVPDLAESWETPDTQHWTFNLRSNVAFHLRITNGRTMTADDVAFSLQRAAGSTSSLAARVQNIESIEVLSPTQVRINLKTPSAAFLDDLVPITIVPQEAVDTLSTIPVGTGPLQFVEAIPNDRIVLERNPNYFEPGVPQVDRLVLRVIVQPEVAINNLLAGEVDVVDVQSVTVLDAQRFAGSSQVQVVRSPASNSYHLIEMVGHNNSLITGDKQVRQALAHALNKDLIQQTVFFGEGQPIWSPLPPSSAAYVELEGYPFDLDRARQLLEEAGASNLEFTVEVLAGFPDGEKICTIWQEALQDIGVNLTVRVAPLAEWLDRYITRNYDVTWNLFNVSADPSSFFSIILTPHLNDQWMRPEVAALIAQANATADPLARNAIYAELQRIVVDELPVMIVQTTPLLALARSGVQNYLINAQGDQIVRTTTVQ